jgi:hypothetical protein
MEHREVYAGRHGVASPQWVMWARMSAFGVFVIETKDHNGWIND